VDCDNTKETYAHILIPHPSILTRRKVGAGRPVTTRGRCEVVRSHWPRWVLFFANYNYPSTRSTQMDSCLFASINILSCLSIIGCTVVRPIQKLIGKWKIRPSRKIWTPQNFILNLRTRDYVRKITLCANFGFNRYGGGFSPNRRNVTTLWFFDCSVLSFFLDPAPRSNRWTDFHALWLKRRVSMQGWSFLGLGRWATSFGGNMPPNGRE